MLNVMISCPLKLLFLVSATITVLTLSTSARAEANRTALVIANASYSEDLGALPNPVKDGVLIAQSLKSVGFSVTLVTDADQKTMKRAISRFGEELAGLGRAGVGLFYYAGHGIQVGGTNYLVPIGADIKREADADLETVEVDSVLKQMEFAGTGINIVILDACRNNPLARSTRSASRGLARMDAPTGSFIAYSTAPGEVAADGAGDNSPFANALTSEIAKPGISIEELFRHVRVSVKRATDNQQVPWDSSSLTDAFVFNPNSPTLVVSNSPSSTGATQDATGTNETARDVGRRYEFRGPRLMELPRELRPTSGALSGLRDSPIFQSAPEPRGMNAKLTYEYSEGGRREEVQFEIQPIVDAVSRHTREIAVAADWQGVPNAYRSFVKETNIVAGPFTVSQIGDGYEEASGKKDLIYYEGRVENLESVEGNIFPIAEGTYLNLKYTWRTQSGQNLSFSSHATTTGAMPCSEARIEADGACYVVEVESSFEGSSSKSFWTLLYSDEFAAFIPWGEFGVDNVVLGKVSIASISPQ